MAADRSRLLLSVVLAGVIVNANGATTTPASIQCGSANIQNTTDCTLDIAFIVDGSGSIKDTNPPGVDNWELVLSFLVSMIDHLRIGLNDSRVGAVTFGNEGIVVFQLTNFTDTANLTAAVRKMPYEGGNTNTTGGLRVARTQIFSTIHGDRPDVPDVAVLVTDGVPTREVDRLAGEVQMYKDAGIRIVGVGVTNAVNETILRSIVTYPDQDYFYVSNFDQYATIVDRVVYQICRPVPDNCYPTVAVPIFTGPHNVSSQGQSCTDYYFTCRVSYTRPSAEDGAGFDVALTFDGQLAPSFKTTTSEQLDVLFEPADLKGRFGTNVSCAVRSYWAGNPTVKSNFVSSTSSFFVGIKHWTDNIVSNRIEMNESSSFLPIHFQATLPIGCSQCSVTLRLSKHTGLTVSSCSVTFYSSDPPHTVRSINVRAVQTPGTNSRVVFLEWYNVSSPCNDSAWDGYRHSNIPVLIVDQTESGSCVTDGDPHIRTFDYAFYSVYFEGDFLLWRSAANTIADVHVRFQHCLGLDTVSCNCAVAFREDNNIVGVYACDPTRPPIAIRYLADPQNAAPQVQISKDGLYFYIVMPSGRAMSVSTTCPLCGRLAITVYSISDDVGHSEGLCGNYNSIADDDRTPRGSSVPENVDEPIKFATSYMVPTNQSYINGHIYDPRCFGATAVLPTECQCGQVDDVNCAGVTAAPGGLTAAATYRTYGTDSCGRKRRKRESDNSNAGDQDIISGNDLKPKDPPKPPTTPLHPNLTSASGINEEQARRLCEEPLMKSPIYIGCAEFTNEIKDAILQSCITDVRLTGNASAIVHGQLSKYIEACRHGVLRNDTRSVENATDDYNDVAAKGDGNMLQNDNPIVGDGTQKELDKGVNTVCSPECQNGVCRTSSCICFRGWFSTDCSKPSNVPPDISDVRYGPEFCDVRVSGEKCQGVALRLFPGTFSMPVICRIAQRNVTYYVEGQQESAIGFRFSLPVSPLDVSSTSSYYAWTVTISNDNETFSTQQLKFFVFDSRCMDCDNATMICRQKNWTCLVSGKCYDAYERSPADGCYGCLPETSNSTFSRGWAGDTCSHRIIDPPTVTGSRLGNTRCNITDCRVSTCDVRSPDVDCSVASLYLVAKTYSTPVVIRRVGTDVVYYQSADIASSVELRINIPVSPLDPESTSANYTWAVSVSNDNVTFSEEMVFVVFDSNCIECSGTTGACQQKNWTCLIDGRCYRDGDMNADQACSICLPGRSRISWTDEFYYTLPATPAVSSTAGRLTSGLPIWTPTSATALNPVSQGPTKRFTGLAEATSQTTTTSQLTIPSTAMPTPTYPIQCIPYSGSSTQSSSTTSLPTSIAISQSEMSSHSKSGTTKAGASVSISNGQPISADAPLQTTTASVQSTNATAVSTMTVSDGQQVTTTSSHIPAPGYPTVTDDGSTSSRSSDQPASSSSSAYVSTNQLTSTDVVDSSLFSSEESTSASSSDLRASGESTATAIGSKSSTTSLHPATSTTTILQNPADSVQTTALLSSRVSRESPTSAETHSQTPTVSGQSHEISFKHYTESVQPVSQTGSSEQPPSTETSMQTYSVISSSDDTGYQEITISLSTTHAAATTVHSTSGMSIEQPRSLGSSTQSTDASTPTNPMPNLNDRTEQSAGTPTSSQTSTDSSQSHSTYTRSSSGVSNEQPASIDGSLQDSTASFRTNGIPAPNVTTEQPGSSIPITSSQTSTVSSQSHSTFVQPSANFSNQQQTSLDFSLQNSTASSPTSTVPSLLVTTEQSSGPITSLQTQTASSQSHSSYAESSPSASNDHLTSLDWSVHNSADSSRTDVMSTLNVTTDQPATSITYLQNSTPSSQSHSTYAQSSSGISNEHPTSLDTPLQKSTTSARTNTISRVHIASEQPTNPITSSQTSTDSTQSHSAQPSSGVSSEQPASLNESLHNSTPSSPSNSSSSLIVTTEQPAKPIISLQTSTASSQSHSSYAQSSSSVSNEQPMSLDWSTQNSTASSRTDSISTLDVTTEQPANPITYLQTSTASNQSRPTYAESTSKVSSELVTRVGGSMQNSTVSSRANVTSTLYSASDQATSTITSSQTSTDSIQSHSNYIQSSSSVSDDQPSSIDGSLPNSTASSPTNINSTLRFTTEQPTSTITSLDLSTVASQSHSNYAQSSSSASNEQLTSLTSSIHNSTTSDRTNTMSSLNVTTGQPETTITSSPTWTTPNQSYSTQAKSSSDVSSSIDGSLLSSTVSSRTDTSSSLNVANGQPASTPLSLQTSAADSSQSSSGVSGEPSATSSGILLHTSTTPTQSRTSLLPSLPIVSSQQPAGSSLQTSSTKTFQSSSSASTAVFSSTNVPFDEFSKTSLTMSAASSQSTSNAIATISREHTSTKYQTTSALNQSSMSSETASNTTTPPSASTLSSPGTSDARYSSLSARRDIPSLTAISSLHPSQHTLFATTGASHRSSEATSSGSSIERHPDDTTVERSVHQTTSVRSPTSLPNRPTASIAYDSSTTPDVTTSSHTANSNATQSTASFTSGGTSASSQQPVATTLSPVWGPWSSWSECSVGCANNRVSNRTRVCQTGNSCSGNNNDIVYCSMYDCPPRTQEKDKGSVLDISGIDVNQFKDKTFLTVLFNAAVDAINSYCNSDKQACCESLLTSYPEITVVPKNRTLTVAALSGTSVASGYPQSNGFNRAVVQMLFKSTLSQLLGQCAAGEARRRRRRAADAEIFLNKHLVSTALADSRTKISQAIGAQIEAVRAADDTPTSAMPTTTAAVKPRISNTTIIGIAVAGVVFVVLVSLCAIGARLCRNDSSPASDSTTVLRRFVKRRYDYRAPYYMDR